MLYSVDRFEEELAVLVDEAGNSRVVLRSLLPDGTVAGDMVSEQDGVFFTDKDATAHRRARILQLQNRLRQKS